jgi:transcriptional regulator with XRE-family HTH domain
MPISISSPDQIDVQVGSRIRLLRQGAQMSQTDLAEQLGVTFQQVQKYEKGMNRIGAGRLTKIAAVLGMPVSELLGDDGAAQSNRRAVAEARSPLKLITPPGALKLLRAYTRIDDRDQRRNIVELVERIASAPGKSK